MGWAVEELAGIELGDKRLEKRSVLLLDRFMEKPQASLPMACRGWAETTGAYRFLGNDQVEWRDILAPHVACTLGRMEGNAVVLCLQDTTELDFNGRQAEGLGPLSYEARRGLYLHATYAVTPERTPLGVLDAWMWGRERKDGEGNRPGIKESLRWTEGYERIAEYAAEQPGVRLVSVGDRENDIAAFMHRAHGLGAPADWLVRAKHNRKLAEAQDETGAEKEIERLWEVVGQGESLGQVVFDLPPRKGRPGRRVAQELYLRRVRLPLPKGGEFEVTALWAQEKHPPAGEKPVSWKLLTNRTAETLEQAAELVDWYRCRWEIEVFFNVLKNGCRVEALQLSKLPRIENALAFYLIVAWRINYLVRLGRACPDLDCEVVFDREEWQAAYLVARKPIPDTPPKLNEVIRVVASFGGFLGRKGDGEPGVKSLWQGLQRVMDFAAGIRAAKEAVSCV